MEQCFRPHSRNFRTRTSFSRPVRDRASDMPAKPQEFGRSGKDQACLAVPAETTDVPTGRVRLVAHPRTFRRCRCDRPAQIARIRFGFCNKHLAVPHMLAQIISRSLRKSRCPSQPAPTVPSPRGSALCTKPRPEADDLADDRLDELAIRCTLLPLAPSCDTDALPAVVASDMIGRIISSKLSCICQVLFSWSTNTV
jgi:hypothetical protein